MQRLLVSAPMVVLPLAQSEMLNSIAMLRWYFIYATFWAVLWVPQTRWGRIIGPAVVILAALSDAVVWIFLPLVVLRWWLRRDRSAVVMGAALLFGTLMVATVVITGATTRGVQPRLEPVWALASYVLRPVPQVLLLPITGLVVLVALVCVVNLRVDGDRTGGPRWSDGLRAARTACDHGGQPVSPPTVAPHQPHPSIPPTGASTANIPVSPARLAWAAHLPCDYLNR